MTRKPGPPRVTKYDLVAEIERRIGTPTDNLWGASKATLLALLEHLPEPTVPAAPVRP
jgi:hypothetical protein